MKLLCLGVGMEVEKGVWGRTGEGGRNLEQKVRAEEMEAVGFCWTSPDGRPSGELPQLPQWEREGRYVPSAGGERVPCDEYSVPEAETPERGACALRPRCTCGKWWRAVREPGSQLAGGLGEVDSPGSEQAVGQMRGWPHM